MTAVLDRFFRHVEQDADDCWVWTAARFKSGYGAFRVEGKTVLAHRWVYESMRADIPAGLHIDHLCRVRECVNPWHLEPVTNRVNVLRGNAPGSLTRRENVCRRGHSMDDAYRHAQGYRVCRTCARAAAKARGGR